MTEFNLELAKNLLNSTDQFPVSFDEAYQWLGYSRKDSAKRGFLNSGFIEGVDFSSLHLNVEREIGGARTEEIKLTIDCFKLWAMLSKTEQGNKVRLYFLECEKVAKQVTTVPIEVMSLLTSMQQQLNELQVDRNTLELAQQEKAILITDLLETKETLTGIQESGLRNPGLKNIIDNQINNPIPELLTAYEFLLKHNLDTDFSNVLARRANILTKTGKQRTAYKNARNVLMFEEDYLWEVYGSLQE